MKRPIILFGRADLIDDPEHAERARLLAEECVQGFGLATRGAKARMVSPPTAVARHRHRH